MTNLELDKLKNLIGKNIFPTGNRFAYELFKGERGKVSWKGRGTSKSIYERVAGAPRHGQLSSSNSIRGTIRRTAASPLRSRGDISAAVSKPAGHRRLRDEAAQPLAGAAEASAAVAPEPRSAALIEEAIGRGHGRPQRSKRGLRDAFNNTTPEIHATIQSTWCAGVNRSRASRRQEGD